jgi:DNA-binding response OmpR family regulator
MSNSKKECAKQIENISILIIEDNLGDFRLLKEELQSESPSQFSINHSETLSEGINHLSENEVDVVLLDLSLPDSQGFDTFRKTREGFPEIPIVVLTGFDDEALATAAVKEGAQDYLVKGQIDGKLLVRSIRYAFERMRAEKALRKNYALKNIQQLAGAVCHEFSQPLQTLSGCLSLIETNENNEYIELCRKMVFRITELLSHLRQITDLKKQNYLSSQIFDIKGSSSKVVKTGKFRILVVDDEEEIVNLLIEGLIKEGYDCDGARDGLEALSMVNTHMYDLIISDINMPRIPGSTFFSMIKAINYPALFVFLTGYAIPEEIQQMVKSADGMIAKPIIFNDLFSIVKNLLNGYSRNQEEKDKVENNQKLRANENRN